MSKLEKLLLDPGKPVECAHHFKNLKQSHVWSPQIRWWWDYSFEHHCYKEVPQATMQHDMQLFLANAEKPGPKGQGRVSFDPHPVDVKVILEALQNDVHRTITKPPLWLDDKHDDIDPRLILPCANGLLNIKTRELMDHTPAFFCNYCLPHGFHPDREVPELWLRCLKEWFGGRQHLIDGLQEAFGYTLSTNRNLQKIFFARGVRGSGKSTTFRVLTALCGETQTASLSIGMLGEKYGLEPCLDALLLLIPDLTMASEYTTGEAASRLKSISGQDALGVRRVGITSVPNVYLPGQLWLGGNIMPNFRDVTDALLRRIVAWPFDFSFEGREDFDLTDKLTTTDSLAGILNWSLAGLDRLIERGKFDEWQESKDIKRELLLLSNPAAAFVTACCDLKSGTEVDKGVLYQAYADYMGEHDMGSGVLDSTRFATKLKEAVQAMGRTLGEYRRQSDDGKRPRAWKGIRLNAENRVRYYKHDPELVTLFGEVGLYTIMTEQDSGAPVPKTSSDRDFGTVESGTLH